jgi:CubicO group peptidase (beta-lactamase class C family)
MHLIVAALLALSAGQRLHVDAVVERVMRDDRVAGLSLGIARRGNLLYLRGYGLRDVSRRLQADGYTIYRIGSITKQFTAALVLQQVAGGSVALDAPVGTYLPAAGEGIGRVTLAQLLAQTGGIESLDAPPAFNPGAGWLYSNANYELLGAVLQRVTGVDYPTLLRDRITAPLALSSTGYGALPFGRNAAVGYAWHGGRWDEAPAGAANADRASSAAAMVSNAPDLLRWLEELRRGRVVTQTAFSAMTASGKLGDGTLTHYGFGFFIANWFGYRAIEHPGYVAGFSSQDALLLDDGLEIAVLANADSVDLTPLTQSIVAALDRPLDPNLAAEPSRPPQNEDRQIAADLKSILQTAGFAALGTLRSLEFVERSTGGGVTYDKYRLTFTTGQWWATIGYRGNGAVASLTLSPIE